LTSDSLGAAGVQEGDMLVATEGGASLIAIRCGSSCSIVPVVITATKAHGEGHLTFTVNAPPPSPTPAPPVVKQSPVPAAVVDFVGQAGIARAVIILLLGVVAVLSARVGRRIALSLCGLLMALTGLDLAVATQGVWLIASGLTGMLGAASVDLGPFASVEQAALAESVSPLRRNIAFARYSLTAGLFNAAGGLAAGLGSGLNGSRGFFLLYAAIGLVTAGLPLFLTKRVESELHEPAFGALRRPEVRRVLAGLSALFALDSFAGGFVTNAVISYWLHVRFGAGPALLGPIF